ncbi:multiple sugar transport system substrate-binding protein [Kibdelosporangium banguiense]|uniref:Multiple sugar transport system substrate-binding protein n=1 Tax=Kibdelosporangium banguiense TaxID=1365924 RepID=A0ABS4TQY8_9PSEU|nr:extracellular solute-binding protein [Kibdelosporangium banguiense]MBP2326360.1 multiple sugar transport system substrate-binding protein [Kibdelosporangium banguiense]
MRRFWLGSAFGAIAIALLTYFVVPAGGQAGKLEKGELVILSGKDQSNGGQRQELVNQWNQLNPNNPARIEELPIGADDQYSEMVARAQAPDQAADVYNLDVTWMAEFAARDYIVALEDVDTSGFLEGPLRTCRYQDELWGLPFNTDAGLMYYQKHLKAPAKWGDIVTETRRVFSEAHDNRLVAGYTAQLDDYEGLVVNALEAVWAANGEVVDEGGDVVIDSPEARTGLRQLADGLREAVPQVIMPDARNQDETRSTAAFGEGKALYMRNWPVAYRALQRLSSDEAGQEAFFKVTTLPGPSVLGGQNLAVSKKSKKPRAAKALIEFLTGPRSQQILFERGGFAATRQVVYLDAELQRLRPYAKELLAAISDARPRPVTPHYARFSETFRTIVNETLRDGGRLPPDAMQRLEAALRGE